MVDEFQSPGRWSVIWDGTDHVGITLPSGLYTYQLKADGKTLTRKMLLIH